MNTISINDMDARQLQSEISKHRRLLDNLPDDAASEQRDAVQGHLDRYRREPARRVDKAVAAYASDEMTGGGDAA